MSESLEKAIESYDTLDKIVEQLESSGYESEGGPLANDVAFVALKRLAEKGEARDN